MAFALTCHEGVESALFCCLSFSIFVATHMWNRISTRGYLHPSDIFMRKTSGHSCQSLWETDIFLTTLVNDLLGWRLPARGMVMILTRSHTRCVVLPHVPIR